MPPLISQDEKNYKKFISFNLRDERDKAITTRKNEELYTVFRKGSVISFSLEHNFEVCDGVSF